MEMRRKVSARSGAGRRWLVLAALALAGCGGPNEADVALFGVATPTSLVIVIATAPPTATPIPALPVLVPAQATLFAGVGAAPDDCNGGAQAFQVSGGVPPLKISSSGGGCLSATILATSGQSFTFTAGDMPGDVGLTVQDALGRTSSATVSIVGAPAVFLKLDVATEQRSDNGDGTFSSVIGAVVTDADGIVVPDRVPVEFTLLDPVAGVAVTSPGLTGQAAPCTPGFALQPQPGDALSCIKYAHSLQGSTVRVRARVRTASGDLLEAVRSIFLPDERPAATATATRLPTVTPTSPPTATLAPTPGAAFMKLDLVAEQRSDNGDGTFSSVIGALITDIDGVTVGDGVRVDFSLVEPVAGISVTSPGLTGAPPPCTLGFAVTPQPGDALSCIKYVHSLQGSTVTIRARVATAAGGTLEDTRTIALPDGRPTATATSTATATPTVTATATPGAAFIKLDLASTQPGDNGDGTFTSILGALITDIDGVTIGDGVRVDFSLVGPVGGVSVTSPGFTGQPPPCAPAFQVQPQPGDALSCIKYVQSLQGTTITVRARVSAAGGEVLEDTRTITLPDGRPTATPTITPTPSPSATQAAAAIEFLGVSSPNVGVRGSGLPEQSMRSFRITGATGVPIPGVAVHFELTGLDDEGVASTTLTTGTRAATIRVIALGDGDGSADLTAQSTAVAVLGAPLVNARFSVAAERLNVSGRVHFGLRNPISTFVNDRFGNAVPAATAVSFLSNGASVVGAGLTGADGVATTTLITERPTFRRAFFFAVSDQQPGDMMGPRATSVVVTVRSEHGDGTCIVASGTIA